MNGPLSLVGDSDEDDIGAGPAKKSRPSDQVYPWSDGLDFFAGPAPMSSSSKSPMRLGDHSYNTSAVAGGRGKGSKKPKIVLT